MSDAHLVEGLDRAAQHIGLVAWGQAVFRSFHLHAAPVVVALYSTILYCTVLYCTALYCSAMNLNIVQLRTKNIIILEGKTTYNVNKKKEKEVFIEKVEPFA